MHIGALFSRYGEDMPRCWAILKCSPPRPRACRQEVYQAAAQGDAKASRPAQRKDDVEIEYVSAPLELVLAETAAAPSAAEDGDAPSTAPSVDEFVKIMQHFGSVEELLGNGSPADAGEDGEAVGRDGGAGADGPGANGAAGGDDSDGEAGATAAEKLSKKKAKLLNQLKIAELKQACDRPEVVEVWDVTSADPLMLVHLKAYRNTVPVPRHWSQKRKFLQGKRGIEKPPFKLPAFIEATGIGEMRQAYLEKAEAQNIKSKGRARMQPKMGKLDIDYQILHDAFFRHQTKPPLTGHGDLYYEGKEYEASVTHARPGVLSPELQEALGIGPGDPPPWLIAMQRHGPPPSYPSLRIPGLNAPIPPGAQFGYHTGGWGKPPVDEYGVPIYGDVFGQTRDGEEDEELGPRTVVHWGELGEEESEEEEEESEEEEEESEEEDGADLVEGYTSVASGISSALPSGLVTPAEVQLRKAAEAHAAAAPAAPKVLYQVLEQQAAAVGSGGILGTDHVYVVPGAEGSQDGGKEKKMSISAAKRLEALRREMPADVEVAIDPSDLDALDDAALKEVYEMKVAEARAAAGKEDFSDLVAAKSAAQKRKAADKPGGKDKKFKF